MSARKFWTTAEMDTVRKHYPIGGIDACLPLLPGRSRAAIYNRAGELKVRAPGQPAHRQSFPNDGHIDHQIRFLHQQQPSKGDVSALAKRIGRPTWYVSRRARDLGLVTPRFREPVWSDAELEILEDTASLGCPAVRRRLAKAGFTRSLTGIEVKRQRLGMAKSGDRAGWHQVGELSKLLGFNREQAGRWIDQGLLKCKPETNTRWVSDAYLREFIIAHPLQVEFRRIPAANQPWFVEMLSGRAPRVEAAA